jgi:hypothetical protein
VRKVDLQPGAMYAIGDVTSSYFPWQQAEYLFPDPDSRVKVRMRYYSGPRAGQEITMALGQVLCPWEKHDETRAFYQRRWNLDADRVNYDSDDVEAAHNLWRTVSGQESRYRSRWSGEKSVMQAAWRDAGLSGDVEEGDSLGHIEGGLHLSLGTLITWAKTYALTHPGVVAQMVITERESYDWLRDFDARFTSKYRTTSQEPFHVSNSVQRLLHWAGRDEGFSARVLAAEKPAALRDDRIDELTAQNQQLRSVLQRLRWHLLEGQNLTGQIDTAIGQG